MGWKRVGTTVAAALLTAAVGTGEVTAAPTERAEPAGPGIGPSAVQAMETVCGPGYELVRDPGGYHDKAIRHVAFRGEIWGYVYLLYNGETGKNCVITKKTEFTDEATWTGAHLRVQGISDPEPDDGYFRSYAGPVKRRAAGHCVAYWGHISDGNGHRATGGRDAWGNCGSRIR